MATTLGFTLSWQARGDFHVAERETVARLIDEAIAACGAPATPETVWTYLRDHKLGDTSYERRIWSAAYQTYGDNAWAPWMNAQLAGDGE